MTWEEVAMQMHYSNPVPYYKVRKFLNEWFYIQFHI
jgi:hypothetical protein